MGLTHHIICKLAAHGINYDKCVRSEQNLADHLTKGLTKDLVNNSIMLGWF